MAHERLNKVMANAGIASRRACDEMIQAGRVTVNGRVVTELGVKVDPEQDQVRVDGDLIKARPATRRSYLMLYKPAGVLSVFDDPRGRPGLETLLQGPVRLYPVGRLDLDSEGLLLLTDDGRLQARIADPRFKLPKTYLVQVEGEIGAAALEQLRRGLRLNDGMTRPAKAERIDPPDLWPRDPPVRFRKSVPDCWIRLTITEGRNRQVRRMTAAVGHPTLRLVRWAVGDWTLEGLAPGQWREAGALA